MDFLLGVFVGVMLVVLLIIFRRFLKEKRGVKSSEYSGKKMLTKLKDTLRHIVFEYNIKRKNNDFLLNVQYDSTKILQLMHRSHFPELCENEKDIGFGIALYIPVNELTESQLTTLDSIIEEETEVRKRNSVGKLEYYLIDLGERVRFGGYLMTRIVNEVYGGIDEKLNMELFSEGNIPYWYN